MSNPICFMIRNEPQEADLIDQVLKSCRAFIGYPPHKPKQNVGEANLKKGLYDVSNIQNWEKIRPGIIRTHGKNYTKNGVSCEKCGKITEDMGCKKCGENYAKQVAANINLVRDAVQGSIILVPRRNKGLVYAGALKKFELLDAPLSTGWGKSYIDSRIANDPNTKKDGMATHVQDLAQSFSIKEKKWVEIQFKDFPEWMRKTFSCGRTTARLRGGNENSTEAEKLSLAYTEARKLMGCEVK